MRSGLATAFILSTLLLAAVYLPLCEGFNGNQTWKKRNLLSQVKIMNSIKVYIPI